MQNPLHFIIFDDFVDESLYFLKQSLWKHHPAFNEIFLGTYKNICAPSLTATVNHFDPESISEGRAIYLIVGCMIYVGCLLPLVQELFSVSSKVRDNYTWDVSWCCRVSHHWYWSPMSSPWHCQDSTGESRARHRLHLRVTNIGAGMLLFWFWWVRCLNRPCEATTGSWEFKMVRRSPHYI